jgi:hypothetical protein
VYRHLISALILSALLVVSVSAQPLRAPKPPEPKAPLSVLSIIPAQGEPGMTVTLNGSGFTGATAAFLGSQQLPTTVLGGKILTLVLPDLPPGVYALYLKREDGATSRPYNFMLQPLKPVASALSPDTVSTCAAGREREVVLSGGNFQPGSKILVDGAAVATRFISPTALAFSAPQLGSGLHQVQVQNPSEAFSGNLALIMDSKPEIFNVSVGGEYVSYYELVVTGKNFQQSSTLVVDGNRLGTGKQVASEREQLVYLGCKQLVYQRHPYDPTPKDVKLQVVNQNGEESGIFSISAP